MTEPTDPLEGLIEPTEPEDHSPLEKPGNKIGPYRLLQVLGSGGMGEVWLAERREPYVQRVALKVVKPGMDTKAVLSRFEQERQVLAQMSHPNIAKVLDAGVNEQGRPYFVMEYVPGKPITEFADEHKLSIQARLEYFLQVCNAIAHAHQKGVIHRDIKPGNILVSRGEIGEVGTGSSITTGSSAKVIDFGVAKAMAGGMTQQTVYTQIGEGIGTWGYMSPEQIEGDTQTPSDVYSLGVLLYELICGEKPYDISSMRNFSPKERADFIRGVEVVPPSKRLLKAIPQKSNRKISTSSQVKQLRELDWVCLKALFPQIKGRYRSVHSLAEDIQHFMTGGQVEAAPRSFSYQIKRYWQRNSGVVISLFLAMALIAVGAIYVVKQNQIANERSEENQRNQARLEQQEQKLEEQRVQNDRLQVEMSSQFLMSAKYASLAVSTWDMKEDAAANYDLGVQASLSLITGGATCEEVDGSRLILKAVGSDSEYAIVEKRVSQWSNDSDLVIFSITESGEFKKIGSIASDLFSNEDPRDVGFSVVPVKGGGTMFVWAPARMSSFEPHRLDYIYYDSDLAPFSGSSVESIFLEQMPLDVGRVVLSSDGDFLLAKSEADDTWHYQVFKCDKSFLDNPSAPLVIGQIEKDEQLSISSALSVGDFSFGKIGTSIFLCASSLDQVGLIFYDLLSQTYIELPLSLDTNIITSLGTQPYIREGKVIVSTDLVPLTLDVQESLSRSLSQSNADVEQDGQAKLIQASLGESSVDAVMDFTSKFDSESFFDDPKSQIDWWSPGKSFVTSGGAEDIFSACSVLIDSQSSNVKFFASPAVNRGNSPYFGGFLGDFNGRLLFCNSSSEDRIQLSYVPRWYESSYQTWQSESQSNSHQSTLKTWWSPKQGGQDEFCQVLDFGRLDGESRRSADEILPRSRSVDQFFERSGKDWLLLHDVSTSPPSRILCRWDGKSLVEYLRLQHKSVFFDSASGFLYAIKAGAPSRVEMYDYSPSDEKWIIRDSVVLALDVEEWEHISSCINPITNQLVLLVDSESTFNGSADISIMSFPIGDRQVRPQLSKPVLLECMDLLSTEVNSKSAQIKFIPGTETLVISSQINDLKCRVRGRFESALRINSQFNMLSLALISSSVSSTDPYCSFQISLGLGEFERISFESRLQEGGSTQAYMVLWDECLESLDDRPWLQDTFSTRGQTGLMKLEIPLFVQKSTPQLREPESDPLPNPKE